MFQMPSTALCSPGESGPRMGEHGVIRSTMTAGGQGDKHGTDAASPTKSGGKSCGVEGAGASGSFLTSMQQESLLPGDSQSSQGKILLVGDSPKVAKTGAGTLSSTEQACMGKDAVGIRIPKQVSRKIASRRRTDGYLVLRGAWVKAIIPISVQGPYMRGRRTTDGRG